MIILYVIAEIDKTFHLQISLEVKDFWEKSWENANGIGMCIHNQICDSPWHMEL